jgi:UDP-glucose 4-epimerase
MKQVLITGAYGFLGRYTAKRFKEQGYNVTGIGHGKWHAAEYNTWGIDQWFETTITFESLININKQYDIIVHCGGGASVGFSYENPYEDFQKSVQSTLSLLEYIRLRCKGCKFIYPSSPAVQGNLGSLQIKENMYASPISPYGFHKKIAEDLCSSYNKNFDIEVGIIRFFSIYGDGLKKQLLWDACNKIDQLDEVSFFGTGNETRDWLHVSDAASLVEKFASNVKGYQIVNGGCGKKTSISAVISLLCKGFEKKVTVKFNGQVKEGDPIHFWADISNASQMDWKPTVDLESGLKQYVQYFKSLKK